MHQGIENQDQTESHEHMVEMILTIKLARNKPLHQRADDEHARQANHNAKQERSGIGDDAAAEIGADHVKGAM